MVTETIAWGIVISSFGVIIIGIYAATRRSEKEKFFHESYNIDTEQDHD